MGKNWVHVVQVNFDSVTLRSFMLCHPLELMLIITIFVLSSQCSYIYSERTDSQTGVKKYLQIIVSARFHLHDVLHERRKIVQFTFCTLSDAAEFIKMTLKYFCISSCGESPISLACSAR